MSRDFSAFPVKPYIGTPFRKTSQIEGKTVNIVPLFFNWLPYSAQFANAANVGAFVNVRFNQAPLLKSVTSIYIDNTNSSVPIYVLFPDTGCVVAAQSNSAGWYLALTNDFVFFVYAVGLVQSQIPSTTIIITDAFVVPNVDPELAQSVSLGKASATIQRGIPIFNSTYAAFALGDQFVQVSNPSTGNSITGPVFPVLASGFYIITSLVVNVDISSNVGQPEQTAQEFFESTGLSGQFMNLQASISGTTAAETTSPSTTGMIFQSGAVQWKINATEFWRIRSVSAGLTIGTGNFQWNFTFTQNPT